MCTPDDQYPTCPHQDRFHTSPYSRCGIVVCGREPPMSDSTEVGDSIAAERLRRPTAIDV